LTGVSANALEWSVISGPANGTFSDGSTTPEFTGTKAGSATIAATLSSGGSRAQATEEIHVIEIGDLTEELHNLTGPVYEFDAEPAVLEIPFVSEYGELLKVLIQPFSDSIDPYEWGSDFSVEVNGDNGNVFLTCERAGQYIVKTLRKDGAPDGELAIILKQTTTPDTNQFAPGTGVRVATPDVDLVLIGGDSGQSDLDRWTSLFPDGVVIHSVQDAINEIEAFSNAHDGQLFSVYIVDHGNVGIQHFGGVAPTHAPGKYLGVYASSAESRAAFAEACEGKVDLIWFGGCNVAAQTPESDGAELLQIIADLSGVRVQASSGFMAHTATGMYQEKNAVVRFRDPRQ
jgi:hypothetical protein